jgi:HSP20 family molecular chaperone IbpA
MANAPAAGCEMKFNERRKSMSQVAIERVDGKTPNGSSVFEEIKTISEKIRQRAFELFECRGGADGLAVNDWLRAEQDLFRVPEAELTEKDGKFKVLLNVPGFDPVDMHVTAFPDALIVRGSCTHTHDKNDCDVRFCEFDQKTLFRRFDLPEPIDVKKVTANLEKGVLQLTAVKAKEESAPQQHAAAA